MLHHVFSSNRMMYTATKCSSYNILHIYFVNMIHLKILLKFSRVDDIITKFLLFAKHKYELVLSPYIVMYILYCFSFNVASFISLTYLLISLK